MSFQAYIDNIKAKTGKTPEEFTRHGDLRHVQGADNVAEPKSSSRWH